MRTTDNSDTTKNHRRSISSQEDEKRKFIHSKLLKKIASISLAGAGIFLLVLLYVMANRKGAADNAGNIRVPVKMNRLVEVEVIDGTGNLRITQHVTEALRILGYDVVEIKRSPDGMVERSYVLDRSGDMESARKLAASLGIPDDKVYKKIDYNLYLDVSVVVGKDYLKLKIFQSYDKGKKS